MPQRILKLLNADTDLEWWFKIGFWLTAIIAPITDLIGGLFILIIIDFITGLAAAKKQKRSIRASEMSNTVRKLFLYFPVVLAGHLVDYLFLPELPILKITSGFIAMTELKSIFENFNDVFGLNIWSYFRRAIKQRNIDAILPPSKNSKKNGQS